MQVKMELTHGNKQTKFPDNDIKVKNILFITKNDNKQETIQSQYGTIFISLILYISNVE